MKFPTERTFQIFTILRINGMVQFCKLIYGTTLIIITVQYVLCVNNRTWSILFCCRQISRFCRYCWTNVIVSALLPRYVRTYWVTCIDNTHTGVQ